MKTKYQFLIIATFLLYSSSFCQTIIFNNQVFMNDTVIVAQKMIFEKGGTVRIRNGAHVTFITNVIEVDYPFTIDGRGEPGTEGASKGDWWSTASHGVNGPIGGGHDGHKQYMDAGSAVDNGNQGGTGGNGAIIDIRYKVFQGTNGGIQNLNCLTSGGDGGKGGAPRKLHCGDHSDEWKWGGSWGSQGTKGVDGRFTTTILQ